MDDADIATRAQDQLLAAALTHCHRQVKQATATGFCLYDDCGALLPPGQRWCNSDCSKAWEMEQRYAS